MIVKILTKHSVSPLLTYSMVQSPSWEVNRFAASQEILRISWNSKFHYRSHKCPTPVPVQNPLDPDHTSKSHLLKIHLNIIFPSAPGSPQVASFIQVFPPKPCIRLSSPVLNKRYMPRPSLDFVTRTMLREEYISHSASRIHQVNGASPPFVKPTHYN